MQEHVWMYDLDGNLVSVKVVRLSKEEGDLVHAVLGLPLRERYDSVVDAQNKGWVLKDAN
jgi:hypothetical protein